MEIFIVLKFSFQNHVEYVCVIIEKEKKIHRYFQSKFLPTSTSTRILKIQNYNKKKINFPSWFIFSIFNCFCGFGSCMEEDGPESWKEPSPHTCVPSFSIISPHKVACFVSLLYHTGNIQLKREVMRLVLK